MCSGMLLFGSRCCVHFSSFIYLSMLRRPPRSTLFPYRRSSDLGRAKTVRSDAYRDAVSTNQRPSPMHSAATGARSEEHTSELQSHSDLVCRLLLEKKKPKSRRKKPQSEHRSLRL